MAAGWWLFAGVVFCLTRTAILEILLKEDVIIKWGQDYRKDSQGQSDGEEKNAYM